MWSFFNLFRETPAQTTLNPYHDPAKAMANINEWIRRAKLTLTTQELNAIMQQATRYHDLNISEVVSSCHCKANAEDILLRLLDFYTALGQRRQALEQISEKVGEIFSALNHFGEYAKEKGIAKVLDAIRSLVKHDQGLDLVQSHLELVTLKALNEPIDWPSLVKVRFICDDLLTKNRALTTVQNISLVLNQHADLSIQRVGNELRNAVFGKLMSAFSDLCPDKESPERDICDDVGRQFNFSRASPSPGDPQKREVRFRQESKLRALSPNLSRSAQVASRRPTPMPVRMHLPGSGKENVSQDVNTSLLLKKFEVLSPPTPKFVIMHKGRGVKPVQGPRALERVAESPQTPEVMIMHMGRRGAKVAQGARVLKDIVVNPQTPRSASSRLKSPLFSLYGLTVSLRPVVPSEDVSNPYLNSKAAIATIDQWIRQAKFLLTLEDPEEILRDASVFHLLLISKIGSSQGSCYGAETEAIFLKLLDLYQVCASNGIAPKQVEKKVGEIFTALNYCSKHVREKGNAKVLDVIQDLLSCNEGFHLIQHHLRSMTCNALSDPIQEDLLSKIECICETLIKKNRKQAVIRGITRLIFTHWKESEYRIKLPHFIDQLIERSVERSLTSPIEVRLLSPRSQRV